MSDNILQPNYYSKTREYTYIPYSCSESSSKEKMDLVGYSVLSYPPSLLVA